MNPPSFILDKNLHFIPEDIQEAGKNLFDQNNFQDALSFFKKALAIREQKQSP